jgi:hypothetical protein
MAEFRCRARSEKLLISELARWMSKWLGESAVGVGEGAAVAPLDSAFADSAVPRRIDGKLRPYSWFGSLGVNAG